MADKKKKRILLLQKLLRLAAILVLKKYKPKIISITGSVGKTSTKEAIFVVLASKFRVRRNEKNYNNEIGIPLTIIGASSGGGSLAGWAGVFLKWLCIIIFPVKYPEILILEMGADRPGDIEYLTNFINSDAGVVTDISYSHIGYFKSVEQIALEKGALVKKLSSNALAVINIDNLYIEKLKNSIKAKIITYGFLEEADVQATDISFVYTGENKEIKGLSFKLNYEGTSIPVRLNIIAKHQIYSVLAACALGIWFELNLVEIAAALSSFYSPAGRMNVIKGIKNSTIIDDTYNASPASVLAALQTLKDIESRRKIAVLGDMLELGEETEKSHALMGEKFFQIAGDIFIGVGERMKFAEEELIRKNFKKENIFHFASPTEAGEKLQNIIKPGDLILVKGSQGMRMEKVVEEVMEEPQKAKELLCRQSVDWKKVPFGEV